MLPSHFQIPIFLAEISPAAFRATFPGVVYQLGNVCSTLRLELGHGLLMWDVGCADDFLGCLPDRSQYVPRMSFGISVLIIFSKHSAGGNNLKTTIIKNGQPTIVPDYATVGFSNTFFVIYARFPYANVRLGSRYYDWCSFGLRTRCHRLWT
jgi:hypothetical protein